VLEIVRGVAREAALVERERELPSYEDVETYALRVTEAAENYLAAEAATLAATPSGDSPDLKWYAAEGEAEEELRAALASSPFADQDARARGKGRSSGG
jgi:hypothetical protein